MKKIIIVFVVIFLNVSCEVTTEMTSNAIGYAILSSTEMEIYYKVGNPTSIIPTPDGGKIMRYEWGSMGMMPTPNTSTSSINYAGNISNAYNPYNRVNYNGTISSTTNSMSYVPYQSSSYLDIFMDKQGRCVNYQYKMKKYELEQFYNRFKNYIPESDKKKRFIEW